MLLMPATGSFSGTHWNNHKACLGYAQLHKVLSAPYHNFHNVLSLKVFPVPPFSKEGNLCTRNCVLDAYTYRISIRLETQNSLSGLHCYTLSSCDSYQKIIWITPYTKQGGSHSHQPRDMMTVFKSALKLIPRMPRFPANCSFFHSLKYPHCKKPRLEDVLRGPQCSIAVHPTSGCIRK